MNSESSYTNVIHACTHKKNKLKEMNIILKNKRDGAEVRAPGKVWEKGIISMSTKFHERRRIT